MNKMKLEAWESFYRGSTVGAKCSGEHFRGVTLFKIDNGYKYDQRKIMILYRNYKNKKCICLVLCCVELHFFSPSSPLGGGPIYRVFMEIFVVISWWEWVVNSSSTMPLWR
ncbi:hypothetical protein QL285_017385 [Trifolium repens]|nr:hypothetical protein QL285_017385 [Trifolium repens]